MIFYRRIAGVTLIEMMIVVVIVAILTAIAYPSYRDFVRKARRSDGMDALLNIQNLQERYRANNTSYGTLAQIGAPNASNGGFYTITVAGNSAVAYTATATGVGDQANDTDDAGNTCTLVIAVSANNPRGAKTPADCW